MMKQWRNVFSYFLLVIMLLMGTTAKAEPITIENQEQLDDIITQLSLENIELNQRLTTQKERVINIGSEQKNIAEQTLHVQNTLITLDEQEEWLSFSTALGETLRQQLLRLPEKPKFLSIDSEIAEIKVSQLYNQHQLENLDDYPVLVGELAQNRQATQYRRLIREQSEILKSLISGDDSVILALTKLKIANKQLADAIDEVNDAAHRYFFWVADISSITISYPIDLAKDIVSIVFYGDVFTQIYHASIEMLQTPYILFLLFLSGILIFIHFKVKPKYDAYLDKVVGRIGKVTQDNYRYTIKVVVFSLFMASPMPILWGVLGYGLKINWNYPAAVAFGSGVNAAAPILWVFMISAQLASPKGLFIAHLGWSERSVNAAMKYYRLSVWLVVPLVILLIGFDQYNNREFAATIGRLSFILLCLTLIFMTNAIHRAGVPLYIDKKGSGDNLFSRALWLLLLCAPWMSIIAACLGYFSTAQILLSRLEVSVVVWFTLLIVYYMIRRWMWIQKRRLEFERAKQKRFERINQRKNNNEDEVQNTVHDYIEEPIIDLDEISAQSLQLVRSIIAMIALISMVLLWSELNSAFAFMENIQLWGTKITLNGVETEQYITLRSIFIAIIVMMITIQLVKNLPALLELGILQHLDLAPGTGYAISTISKYLILMLGCMMAFSFIGIDWSKIQWLIAALGVGLGFGLQEIFANFISGLIMLFEKPVRIGDTVTIRDLTGTITKINTRATTIVDWDRKEIVMPNKAFITEQLINWSLSDAVTRIVLTIPATIDADSELVLDILKQAAWDCDNVLNEPEPQAFLVDIQEGIQLFELRIFCNDMSHRLPARSQIQQLIIDAYRHHNLELPFPPFHANLEAVGRKNGRRFYTTGSM